MKPMFRSLRVRNYRLWAGCALISNIGSWMQRTAQDWLVLTELTHHDAAAVGITMSLQFGPQVLLIGLTGYAADHFDRRKLLLCTQGLMGLLALGLGLLVLSGAAQLWQVYGFALALGCTTAFDTPARQTFVADLVGEQDLSNAVALNSTSFNMARMVGPALAGTVIAAAGTGWAFVLNAASFVAVLVALRRLDLSQLYPRKERAQGRHGSLAAGLRYVWQRDDLRALLLTIFLVGAFGLNFPIFISTMAVTAFHANASGYGLLTTMMAVGSVCGALMAAGRERPRLRWIYAGAILFGLGCTAAALMPTYWLFGATLVVLGIAAQTITVSTNSLVQMSTEPAMRGRVIAILMAVLMGSTPIGAPFVGWVANQFGPRWALGVAALSGFGAALAGYRLWKSLRRTTMQAPVST
ncbi:MFS transporter, partial [Bordetella sp. FB-8]|uniref:MFS transporter n=1 Tax=Bordetella sp. FB-8 TaxID=1159870 RepID=UPI0003A79670